MSIETQWVTKSIVLYRIGEQFDNTDLETINHDMENAIRRRQSKQFSILLDGTKAAVVSFTPREMIKHSPYLKSESVNQVIAFGSPMYTATMGSIFSLLRNQDTPIDASIAEDEQEAREAVGLAHSTLGPPSK